MVGRDEKVDMKIKVISNEDKEFQSKVEYLLSMDDIVTNPIHYLMDDKILKNMDDIAKERYLLSVLDKYSRFRQQTNSSSSRFCMWDYKQTTSKDATTWSW